MRCHYIDILLMYQRTWMYNTVLKVRLVKDIAQLLIVFLVSSFHRLRQQDRRKANLLQLFMYLSYSDLLAY